MALRAIGQGGLSQSYGLNPTIHPISVGQSCACEWEQKNSKNKL